MLPMRRARSIGSGSCRTTEQVALSCAAFQGVPGAADDSVQLIHRPGWHSVWCWWFRRAGRGRWIAVRGEVPKDSSRTLHQAPGH